MKQAYERYLDERDWEYREIEVLPHCKRVTEFGYVPREYQLVRRKVFFGLIPKVYWLSKEYIEWYDVPLIEYYDCSCGEE